MYDRLEKEIHEEPEFGLRHRLVTKPYCYALKALACILIECTRCLFAMARSHARSIVSKAMLRRVCLNRPTDARAEAVSS